MKHQYHKVKRAIALSFVVLLTMCLTPALCANGLVTGHYVFRARYAALCLDGTYPIVLGRMYSGCYMTIHTDALGQLSGTVDIRGVPGQLTGSLGLSVNVQNAIELDLHMSANNATNTPADVFAFLHITQFLGEADNTQGDANFTMDASAAEQLTVTFDLNLMVNGQDQVTGSGTASSCSVQVPVTVTGTNGGNCSLHIVGTNLTQFTWDGSGPVTAFGFVASWSGNGFGFSPSGAQLPIFAPNAPALTPYAVSRKDHLASSTNIPAFTTYNIPLSGTPGVECRSGGALGVHQLVISFPKNITLNPPNGTPAVRVSSGIGSVSQFVVSNDQVIVNLTGVTNAQTITVTLSHVSDGTNTTDVMVSARFLLGDTNGNGAVNSTDVSQTKLQSGQAVTSANFRSDINLSGSINASDVSSVKLKTGTALP